MKKESNINIRVDKELKDKCEKLYESLGINMSIAINLFLNQSLRANGIPFEIKASNEIDKEINGKKETIKINKKKIDCINKNELLYFEYNNQKYVIAYENVDAFELCIYPSVWKIETKNVLPSVIHFETSNIKEYKSLYYNDLLDIKEDIIKILVLKNISKLSIHPNGQSKKLLLPEDKVNGINITSSDELDNLIENYNNFHEFKEYKI